MAAAHEAPRVRRVDALNPRPQPKPGGAGSQANSISASQARAAHRRAARRDELAVAAWLRELAAPTR